ncbi:MAG: NTP transferase domain-containing protein, partial [Caldisericia bacterium]|nr:NTP transferase domain-containing protein [Caldisericia bacterium]
MHIDILVMAGGSEPQWYHPPIENKTQIPIHGKACLEWIADAIQNSKTDTAVSQTYTIRTILLGTRALETKKNLSLFDTFVLTSEDNLLSDNVRLGMEAVQGEYVLLVTGDIPCIRAEHIHNILHQLQENDTVDIYVPIVEKSAIEDRFPGSHRTYGKIKEGSV